MFFVKSSKLESLYPGTIQGGAHVTEKSRVHCAPFSKNSSKGARMGQMFVFDGYLWLKRSCPKRKKGENRAAPSEHANPADEVRNKCLVDARGLVKPQMSCLLVACFVKVVKPEKGGTKARITRDVVRQSRRGQRTG